MTTLRGLTETGYSRSRSGGSTWAMRSLIFALACFIGGRTSQPMPQPRKSIAAFMGAGLGSAKTASMSGRSVACRAIDSCSLPARLSSSTRSHWRGSRLELVMTAPTAPIATCNGMTSSSPVRIAILEAARSATRICCARSRFHAFIPTTRLTTPRPRDRGRWRGREALRAPRGPPPPQPVHGLEVQRHAGAVGNLVEDDVGVNLVREALEVLDDAVLRRPEVVG